MVAGNTFDELDVSALYRWPPRLRFSSQKIPEPFFLPSDNGVGLDDDQSRLSFLEEARNE